MKKFINYYLSMAFIASLFVVTSCGEDEPIIESPTVTSTATENESTVDVGEKVSFTVNVTAPGGFNTLIVNQTLDNETKEIDNKSRAAGTTTTTHSYSFSFTPTAVHAGKEIVFDFIAVDDAERERKYTHTVNVKEQGLTEYQTVLLGGQANTTESSFFNALENVKYKYSQANENPAKVDFLYHYGETNLNIIASPDDADSRAAWADLYKLPLSANMNNKTRFKRVTVAASNYANVNNNTALVNAYTENSNTELSRLTKLNQGETFVFKLDNTRGSRYGVVEVVEVLAANAGGANRTIKLNVKIQSVSN